MDGVLVVDKPAGPTSHDVVARVRRALAFRKIGHTGTLDPMATGVLPLVLGRATRLARFMTQGEKVYDAEIRLGIATDTYDATGIRAVGGQDGLGPAEASAVDLSTEAIEQALQEFRGTYLQTPPPYSAKKVDGERAYRRARRGETMTLQPVPVTVRHLELTSHDEDRVRLRVECTAGFYVRTLAHDLGVALGCGARLESLRRVRSGDCTLDASIALDQVERTPEAALERIVPLRQLLPAMPAIVLNQRGAKRALHGHDVGPGDLEEPSGGIGLSGSVSDEAVRLLAVDGDLLAIAQPRIPDGALHPIVVLG